MSSVAICFEKIRKYFCFYFYLSSFLKSYFYFLLKYFVLQNTFTFTQVVLRAITFTFTQVLKKVTRLNRQTDRQTDRQTYLFDQMYK